MADTSVVKGKSPWGAAVLGFFLPGLRFLNAERKVYKEKGFWFRPALSLVRNEYLRRTPKCHP
jgi:hypothetical protein